MPNSTTTKIPERYESQPELVAAIIEARRVRMETEDTAFAVEWLLDCHPKMSIDSATRVLNDETFRFVGLYPPGHPGLEAMKAERRAKGRRGYNLQKLRPQVIDRDGSRCQFCNKRVEGREAQLDHKEPEGPDTLENIHLLCSKCNVIKGKRSWDTFLTEEAEWRAGLERVQNARPDFTCKQTGLSVRGRSWADAGCLSPWFCKIIAECDNGGYEAFEAEMDKRHA